MITVKEDEAHIDWLSCYPSWCNANIEGTFFNKNFAAMNHFLKLEYWKRVWIFQELVLGNRILFLHGTVAIPYEEVERAATWLRFVSQIIHNRQLRRQLFIDQHI